MAGQSKLPLPKDRTIRGMIANLTRLYVSNRTRISRAVWITLFIALANRIRHAVSEQKAASVRDAAHREARQVTTAPADGKKLTEDSPRKKVELNREFFKSLLRLLKIVIPAWKSKEARLLVSHSFFLVLRTLISVRVAEMDGAIVKALVKGKGKEFLKRIVWWMLIAVPATFTNSMVRKTCPIVTIFPNEGLTAYSYHTTKPSYHSSTERGSPNLSTTNTFLTSPFTEYPLWTTG